jgi:hypothetical protein
MLTMTQAIRWIAGASVWWAACSTSVPAKQTSGPQSIPVCVVTGESTVSQQGRESIAAFRHAVETGPLFTVPASRAAVASCRIGFESGVASLEYQFSDGGWLRAKHDARIDYNDQEVRAAVPPAENPISILTRAERVAFGDKGCGIDWKEKDTQPAEDDRGAVEAIYRGDTCNCQARVRTDAAGRVVGLTLRSAC